MNVLKKRFIPCLLACVIVLTMIAPAFASSAGRSTTVNGQYVEAVIDVVVPTTATAFINPYALPVKLSQLNAEATTPNATEGNSRPAHSASSGSILNQQIVTEPMFITNKSEVNLTVSAKVTGTPKSHKDGSGNNIADTALKFVDEAIESDDNKKDIFAYMQMKVVDELTKDSTAGDMITAFTTWTDDSYDENKDVLVSAKGTTRNYIAILKAGEASGGDADGPLDATNGSIAMFRIAGQVVADPKEPWEKTTDTFTIDIAFTFRPDPIKATITGKSKTIDASSGTISLTASLTGVPNGDDDITTKLTSITWTVGTDNSSLVEAPSASNQSGSNNATFVVTPTATAKSGTGGEKKVTINVSIAADNGMTYTASYEVTLNIPT